MAKRIFLLFLIAVFGCDTQSSLNVQTSSYFVKYYGGDGNQVGVDLIANADGTFYLLGTTDSKDLGKQVYLVKAESNGNLLWEKTFGDIYDDEAKDFIVTSDGNIAFVASTAITDGNHDLYVVTLKNDGTIINSIDYKTTGSKYDEIPYSISQTSDGFIVTGSTTNVFKKGGMLTPDDLTDGMQYRYKSNLTPYPASWRQTVGYEGNDVIVGIQPSTDTNNSFYLFGYSNKAVTGSTSSGYKYWISQLGVTGEPSNDALFPGFDATPAADEILTSAIVSPFQNGEGFLLSGQSYDQGGVSDLFVVKVRKSLSFTSQDYLIKKSLSIDLKVPLLAQKVSAWPSQSSGYLILANDARSGNDNWYLTKIDNIGNSQWNLPIIFGGENDDTIGAVAELSDGKIAMLGTMEIGGRIPEKKMTLIKVNSAGKFAN
jgi:hypothetical protein